MALSDSMFLFEVRAEELRSFINCHQFLIRSQFADIFTLNLKDPNDFNVFLSSNYKMRRPKRKVKVRYAKPVPEKSNLQTGQTVLVSSSPDALITNMMKYPMELVLWDKRDAERRLGSAQILWSTSFMEYLNKLNKKLDPIAVTGIHNVFDEYTSRRMAVIKLSVKLTCLKDHNLIRQYKALSENNNSQMKEETGVIKTIFSHGNRIFQKVYSEKDKPRAENLEKISEHEPLESNTHTRKKTINQANMNLSTLVKSQTDIDKNKQIAVVKSKSCSSIEKQQINTLNYIFGDNKESFGNQVYCVGYCTVENDLTKDSNSSKSSSKAGSSDKSVGGKSLKMKDCPSKKGENKSNTPSLTEFDKLATSDLINLTKCKNVACRHKNLDRKPEEVDDRILIDLTNSEKNQHNFKGKVEQVVGGMKAKLKIGDKEPCFCECECKFGFIKKTTYCNICGGYEVSGEDTPKKQDPDSKFPCPIFHKLEKKNKAYSTSGSDSIKKSKKSTAEKSAESEKDKKGKKKKRDDRFKFNYGYTAPKIGHSRCAFPCTGTLGAVPKNMGWLWTADNVPGLKFRPMWKPGATNKFVVRLLRIAKNPGEVISKKKKKDFTKKKPLKRPLLVVHKKDGEYTVTMETVKSYPKPRTINQQPYEDKPLVTYTIGRTEEENLERQKKKDRLRRRLEREQREFIQSAFRDMCQEICLKTYQQALGILPDAENPECPCYPAEPGPDQTDLDHSCSCSEDKNLSSLDTDDDEWIVEFTPPSATFDPTMKTKKIISADSSTQYTYLDYRVKLLDRYGNPVPRFFKGPDGKQQCSDLGGFWSPDHRWLEINVDGFIAPDGRWAPNAFIGPNGEQVDCETGKFQSTNGTWLVVGIDGYIDPQGRWKFYGKQKGAGKLQTTPTKKYETKKVEKPAKKPMSQPSWSCFGFASPKHLSKLGIVGHGQGKKLLLATLKDMLARGEDVTLPIPSTVPRRQQPKKGKGKGDVASPNAYSSRAYFEERARCRHPVPSEKGVIATDARGHKTYFRLKDYKNRRPEERMADLSGKGISLSSFHVPCFHSFISTETMKKQLYDRIRAKYAQSEAKKTVSTQI